VRDGTRGGWPGERRLGGGNNDLWGLGFSLMWGPFCSQSTNLSIVPKS
jgi:hypothetical protein